MRSAIEDQCPGVHVGGEPTESVSGAFEVANLKSGKVYHSKLGGQGFIHNDEAKMKAVVTMIRADFPADSQGQK